MAGHGQSLEGGCGGCEVLNTSQGQEGWGGFSPQQGGGCQEHDRGAEGTGGGTPFPSLTLAATNSSPLSLQEEDIEYYDSKADTEYVSAVSVASLALPRPGPGLSPSPVCPSTVPGSWHCICHSCNQILCPVCSRVPS